MLNDGGVADSLLYVKYECVKVLWLFEYVIAYS